MSFCHKVTFTIFRNLFCHNVTFTIFHNCHFATMWCSQFYFHKLMWFCHNVTLTIFHNWCHFVTMWWSHLFLWLWCHFASRSYCCQNKLPWVCCQIIFSTSLFLNKFCHCHVANFCQGLMPNNFCHGLVAKFFCHGLVVNNFCHGLVAKQFLPLECCQIISPISISPVFPTGV